MDLTFAKELASKEITSIDLLSTAFDELGADRCSGLGLDLQKETLTLK